MSVHHEAVVFIGYDLDTLILGTTYGNTTEMAEACGLEFYTINAWSGEGAFMGKDICQLAPGQSIDINEIQPSEALNSRAFSKAMELFGPPKLYLLHRVL